MNKDNNLDEVMNALEKNPSIFSKLSLEMQKKIVNKFENRFIAYLDTPTEFLESPVVALSNIKNNVKKLDYFSEKAITDEVAYAAIENGYYYDYFTSRSVLSNPIISLYLVKKDLKIFSKVLMKGLSRELIEYVLENGYVVKKDDRLLQLNIGLDLIIKRDPSLLNYIPSNNITKEIVSLAASNGFQFDFHGDRTEKKHLSTYESFTDDIEYTINNNLYLLKYDELVFSSYLKNPNILLEEKIPKENIYLEYMVNDFINNKRKITFLRNIDLLENKKFKDYFFKELFPSYKSQELLKYYLNIFEEEDIYLNIKKISYLLKDDFASLFNDDLYFFIKYLIIPKYDFDILNLLEKVNPKDLYNFINQMSYYRKDEFRPVFLLKVCSFLEKYEFLLIEINNSSLKELYENINFCLDTCDIEINSLEDLKELRLKRFFLIKEKNISIKEKVFQYFYGADLINVKMFLIEYMNPLKWKFLKNKYSICSNYLEYELQIEKMAMLYQANDRELALYFNNFSNFVPCSLEQLKVLTNQIFANIYNTNLVDLKSIPKTVQSDINVYNLNGCDFSFFAHVVNACDYSYTGEGYHYDLKYKKKDGKMEGKSYLCLSYLNQNSLNLILNSDDSIVILYQNIAFEQLFAMSYQDTNCFGEDDFSLNVRTSNLNYLPPIEMAYKTRGYSEFDFYRENSLKEAMKPFALLVFSDSKDKHYELAKKLKIPIIQIDKNIYLQKQNENYILYKNEVLSGNLKHLEELFGLSYSLNKKLSLEEIEIILSFLKDEEKEKIAYLMHCYDYQSYDFLKENLKK